MVKTSINKGYVTQIIGPVLDIVFPDGNLPPIYSAIKIETEDGQGNITFIYSSFYHFELTYFNI